MQLATDPTTTPAVVPDRGPRRHSPRTTARRGGRPRDLALTDRLLSVALGLVAENGLDRLNAHALVIAAGAGKATVYRRWPSTDVMVAEAVSRCRPIPAAADTGSIRDDLVALLGPLTRPLTRDERGMASVLGGAHHCPDIRTALEAALVDPLLTALTQVVGRHTRRGNEVSAEREALVRRLVLALWWARFATDPAPSTGEEIQVLVDRVLVPLLGD